jgi:hypothetical protein
MATQAKLKPRRWQNKDAAAHKMTGRTKRAPPDA